MLQSSANTATGARRSLISAVRRDLLLVAGLVAGLLVLTSLPYLYAVASSPPDRRFMGILLDVPDTTQYFAWQRAHQDALLVSNTMTPEPNSPAFFNLLWLILGRLSLWTGLSFVVMFQVLRVAAGFAFAGALFWLYGLLSDHRKERLLATVLVLCGGGIGWVWAVEKYLSGRPGLLYPLDAQVAEPNALLSLMGYPHFLAAASLLMGAMGLFLLGSRSGRMVHYGGAAALALLLSLQHAYDLIILYAVLGAFVAFRWRRDGLLERRQLLGLILVGAVSSPPAAYFAYLTSSDPLWRQVLSQFTNAGVFTPSVPHLLIVLGPQLPLAWAALPRLLRRRSDSDLLLLCWTVVGFCLLYIPVSFQIHMLNPYQVPLAILAVRTIMRVAAMPGKGARLRRFAPAALLVIAALVNVYLVAWRFVDLGRHQPPYSLHRDEVAALQWLDRHGSGVVLSAERLGQYVPALTGKPAVLAHWAQTIDYFAKRDAVAAFFSAAASPAQREDLVQRHRVSYVLAGEEELRAGAQRLLQQPGFEPVFEAPGAVVYRVRDSLQGGGR